MTFDKAFAIINVKRLFGGHMYKIYKITSNPTVDYAAEELKKYLRMMMTDSGEISIEYEPSAKDGFRLGLIEERTRTL